MDDIPIERLKSAVKLLDLWEKGHVLIYSNGKWYILDKSPFEKIKIIDL